MVTLDDLQTMDGMGVIKGSSWKVPPLEDNPCRFAWCASHLGTQTNVYAPGNRQQQHHTFCHLLYIMQDWRSWYSAQEPCIMAAMLSVGTSFAVPAAKV